MSVLVRLLGGLGNQMFQYAAGRALADRHGVELALDLTAFETYGLRRYELDAFAIRARVATPEDLEPYAAPAARTFQEQCFSFNAGLPDLTPPVRLEGYWQSERYFQDIKDALRADFTLRRPLDAPNREMLARIGDCASVSLHVRRGDYVSNPVTNEFHGVLGLEYYRAAVACVADREPEPHLFVFSDDPQWAQANLDLGHPATFVAHNDPDHGWLDMRLMSACRHHIIANSSFSWWGAWLGSRPDGIVAAPRRWFNQGPCDTGDLFPEGWTLL
ncbi:MAG: alpha-1,2-fucosyltransferase [Acidobacteriota bacterium]